MQTSLLQSGAQTRPASHLSNPLKGHMEVFVQDLSRNQFERMQPNWEQRGIYKLDFAQRFHSRAHSVQRPHPTQNFWNVGASGKVCGATVAPFPARKRIAELGSKFKRFSLTSTAVPVDSLTTSPRNVLGLKTELKVKRLNVKNKRPANQTFRNRPRPRLATLQPIVEDSQHEVSKANELGELKKLEIVLKRGSIMDNSTTYRKSMGYTTAGIHDREFESPSLPDPENLGHLKIGKLHLKAISAERKLRQVEKTESKDANLGEMKITLTKVDSNPVSNPLDD